jgi:hypothetical protein
MCVFKGLTLIYYYAGIPLLRPATVRLWTMILYPVCTIGQLAWGGYAELGCQVAWELFIFFP